MVETVIPCDFYPQYDSIVIEIPPGGVRRQHGQDDGDPLRALQARRRRRHPRAPGTALYPPPATSSTRVLVPGM